jgi:hypothetical protein
MFWRIYGRSIRQMEASLISSFVFLTNVVHFLTAGYFVYAFLFLVLFITSVIVRLKKDNIWTLAADKIAILFVILYGLMLFHNKSRASDNYIFIALILFTFLAVVYLYVYGWCTDSYCFSEEGELYRAGLHCISSLGHHLIVLM